MSINFSLNDIRTVSTEHSRPIYFHYEMQLNVDSVLAKVRSDNPICTLVSIQHVKVIDDLCT